MASPTASDVRTAPHGSPRSSTPTSPRRPGTPRATVPITLENFETSWKTSGGAHINSPRSLAVCATYGITTEELLPKPFEAFKLAGAAVSDAIARRRYEHAEAKRLQKLALLRSERQELIERPPSQNTSVKRSSTPNSSMSSPARESARRNRESQAQRLAELEAQRATKAKELLEEVELRTALAAVQKFTHQEEVTAKQARDHLRHVEETSRNAKRILTQTISSRRESTTRHELERAIKSLDAQANLLRKAQERGLRHGEALLDARQRASSATTQAKKRHMQKVEHHAETAAQCEARVEELMAQRTDAGRQHDAMVANGHDRALQLAAEEKARRGQRLAEKSEQVESYINEVEAKTSAERERSASRRRERELSARSAAEERLAQKRGYLQKKTETIHRQFDDNLARTTEERLWSAEAKRQAAIDRAEEVARVRRAKEYERKQALLAKHAAHGCTEHQH